MKGTAIQIVATLVISMGQFFFAFTMAWPSYSLEILKSDDSPIGYKITMNEGILIGSLPMLGGLIGTPISGWMIDAMGRKRSGILFGLCHVLGWSIIATANNAILIIISRFILGLANGGSLVLAIPFISEIGTDRTKGPLLSMSLFIFASGTLVSYVVGWLMSYQAVNYLSLSLSVTYVVLMSLLKESPVYLLSKCDEKEALKCLKFYRGFSKATQEVLDEHNILRIQNCPIRNSDNETSELNSEKREVKQEYSEVEISAWKTLCTSKHTQRALAISTVNLMLLVFGGTIGVTAYAGHLFSIGAPGLSKHICSILLSLAIVIGGFLSTIATSVLSRRTLYISSAVLSSISLAVLASLLRWSWAPEWMVPTVMLTFLCIYQTGVASVPFVQMGEMFVPKVKGLVSVITSTLMSIGNFIVLACFTPAVENIGLDGTFLFLSMECALTGVVAYFIMKETKGMSIEEIQTMFDEGYLYTRQRIKANKRLSS